MLQGQVAEDFLRRSLRGSLCKVGVFVENFLYANLFDYKFVYGKMN